MISYLDKMNLRPAEKRLVVFAAIAVFVVVNLIFVVPSFGEWGRIEQQIKDSRVQLDKYAVEVRKHPVYAKELERLRKIGQAVPSEDQALDVVKTVSSEAARAHLAIQNISGRGGATGKTNLFFEERTASATMNGSEEQLVDFLYYLGKSDSLIRVRAMNLTPDPARMRLNVNFTFVASYQKLPASRAAAQAKSAAAAATTATTTAATSQVTAPVASPFKAPPTYPKTNRPTRLTTNQAVAPRK